MAPPLADLRLFSAVVFSAVVTGLVVWQAGWTYRLPDTASESPRPLRSPISLWQGKLYNVFCVVQVEPNGEWSRAIEVQEAWEPQRLGILA